MTPTLVQRVRGTSDVLPPDEQRLRSLEGQLRVLPAKFGYEGIQTPILVMAVIVIVGDVLLRRTRFLRQIYYIGANIRSARLSGIKVVRIQVFNYVLVNTAAPTIALACSFPTHHSRVSGSNRRPLAGTSWRRSSRIARL